MGGYYDKYIFQYVNGMLEPRDVHFLEQQDDFMKRVISFTKDKKYYEKLPSGVKKDGKFAQELIDMFDYDHEFLTVIGQNFLDPKSVKSEDEIEVIVKLSDIYEETLDDVLHEFYSEGEDFYKGEENRIRRKIMAEQDYYERKRLGEGFELVEMTSPKIREFIAKKMTEKMFLDHPSLEFEEIVHYYNTSKTCIIDGQERKFLFDYVKEEDKALADYLGLHPRLTDKYIPMLKEVKRNWDNYLEILNEDKLEQVKEEMNRFIEENNLFCDMIDLYRGIIDLSINRNKILKYLPVEELNKKDYKKVDYSTMDIPTLRFVKHMTTYLDEAFDKDVPYDDMVDIYNNSNEKDNIISIKPFIKK